MSRSGRRIDSLQNLISAGHVPELVVVSHTSPCDEKYTRNGIVRIAHVVVKNTPFQIVLGLRNPLVGGQPVDFNHFTVDSRLVYDSDGPLEKEVDFVKVKPVEVKAHVNERADQTTLEFKIKVLTSQHEDMFFRARIVALDPSTGNEFVPSVSVLSDPIKVISKPEQLKKRKPSKKRTLTDLLVDTVTRIEKQQHEQQKLIERLVERGPVSGLGLPAPILLESIHPPERSWEAKGNSDADFETAFASFITAYNGLPHDERPEKIRKLIRTNSAQETEQLTELVDMFTAEGLQQGVGSEISAGQQGGCHCQNCPHKQELLRIDDFYKEFLTSPILGDNVPPSFT